MAQRTSGEGLVESVAVELDRSCYAPGDTVTGSVSLSTLETIRTKERAFRCCSGGLAR